MYQHIPSPLCHCIKNHSTSRFPSSRIILLKLRFVYQHITLALQNQLQLHRCINNQPTGSFSSSHTVVLTPCIIYLHVHLSLQHSSPPRRCINNHPTLLFLMSDRISLPLRIAKQPYAWIVVAQRQSKSEMCSTPSGDKAAPIPTDRWHRTPCTPFGSKKILLFLPHLIIKHLSSAFPQVRSPRLIYYYTNTSYTSTTRYHCITSSAVISTVYSNFVGYSHTDIRIPA